MKIGLKFAGAAMRLVGVISGSSPAAFLKLLLESGDYLLQESGDFILLE